MCVAPASPKLTFIMLEVVFWGLSAVSVVAYSPKSHVPLSMYRKLLWILTCFTHLTALTKQHNPRQQVPQFNVVSLAIATQK